MPSILRRAWFAAFFAAFWSAPVFSCQLCDHPPLVPPYSLAQDDPFDLRVAPGLLPGEQEALASAQGGRYRIQGSHILDTKAADSQHHLATTAQVLELLKPRTLETVSSLRERERAKRITPEDRRIALGLYWCRGPLLSETDREFLASLNPESSRDVAIKDPFNKVAMHKPAAPEGPAVSQAMAGAHGLAQRLLRQVELVGDENQREALHESIQLLLATPTGRELSEEFIAAGAKAEITFVVIPGSKVVEENGKKVVWASGGYVYPSRHPMEIGINRDYLQADRIFRQHYMTATIAHELLGHGLETVRAGKAGVLVAYAAYRENEANAGLVEWVVSAELGARLDNPHMWRYLKDPEEYHQQLQVNLPYYATIYNAEEIKDVFRTLGTRLANANAELAKIPEYIAGWEAERPVIEHFIMVHDMARALFRSLFESIDNAKRHLARNQNTLKEIVTYLEEIIEDMRTEAGVARMKHIQDQFKSDFFRQEEVRIKVRRERLEQLVRGRSYEPFSPPPPGQVTWPELEEMRKKDIQEHPGHWTQEKQ